MSSSTEEAIFKDFLQENPTAKIKSTKSFRWLDSGSTRSAWLHEKSDLVLKEGVIYCNLQEYCMSKAAEGTWLSDLLAKTYAISPQYKLILQEYVPYKITGCLKTRTSDLWDLFYLMEERLVFKSRQNHCNFRVRDLHTDNAGISRDGKFRILDYSCPPSKRVYSYKKGLDPIIKSFKASIRKSTPFWITVKNEDLWVEVPGQPAIMALDFVEENRSEIIEALAE